ncbi:hypothetical protein P9112_000806 [Eukaryota sp. TZLM1-RC]
MHFRQRSLTSKDSQYKFAPLDFIEQTSSVETGLNTTHHTNASSQQFTETSLLQPVVDDIPLLEELGLSFESVFSYGLDFIHPKKIVSLHSPDVFGPCIVVFFTALISTFVSKSVAPFTTFYSSTLFSTLFLSFLFSLLSNTVPLRLSAALQCFGFSLFPSSIAFLLFPILTRISFALAIIFMFICTLYGSLKSALSIANHCNLMEQLPLVLIPQICLNLCVILTVQCV